MEFVLCWLAAPGHGTCSGVVDIPGDTALGKLIFPFPRTCQLQTEKFLVIGGNQHLPCCQCLDPCLV